MNGTRRTLLLAWRYVTFYKARTLLLAACIALTLLLPIAVSLLVRVFGDALLARAHATPLVVGARGSRFDLVLSSLYFQGRVPDALPMAEAERLRAGDLCDAVPLVVRQTAQGRPVVGTTLDYFAFRGLVPAAGVLPCVLGDAVLGARAARELGLRPGDRLLTDRGSLYDLSLASPLRLNVVGVLAEAATPDDLAVFVDVKTAWIIDGLGHGHQDARSAAASEVLERSEQEVVLGASVVEYVEITPANIDTFHFHGDLGAMPLTALLAVPRDAKAATQLKGRYRVSDVAQILVPVEVVEEILGFVLRLKTFFDANFVLVSAATLLFLVLIVLLSLRVRKEEIETLERIGCARLTVFKLVAFELLLTLGAGLLVAALVGGGLALLMLRGLPGIA